MISSSDSWISRMPQIRCNTGLLWVLATFLASGCGDPTPPKPTPPKKSATITVTPSASIITTTQPLTVTVGVSGGTGNLTPTGTVTLTSGSYSSTSTPLSGGGATINIPAGSLTTGNDTLTVTYSGDSNYNSNSGTTGVTVTTPPKKSATITVTPSASIITTTQPLTVTVGVSGGTGDLTPTGTVTLTSGSYSSTSTPLSGGGATINIPAGSLTTGNDTLTVTYSGDSNYNSNSGTTGVTVTTPPLGIAITYHNDNQRTGQNLQEVALTPKNVNSTTFGKLFSYPVDGAIYGQPLYVQNLQLPAQGVRNVVYVVTEHDSVYAFDADEKSPGTLWRVSLADAASNVSSVPCADEKTPPAWATTCDFIWTEIGITSTPVIDVDTKTLYVSAFTKEGTTYVHRLHALDLVSGAEKFGAPIAIQGSVSGTGRGGDGTNVAFDPILQLQRSALLLNNGVLYIAFASFSDRGPYHGWIFGYDSHTLQQRAILNLTPNGGAAGIWESGNGAASDSAGNLYVVTGNGTFTANSEGQDYGDSFVKLTQEGNSLSVKDFFAPFNQISLSNTDEDLGSGGPVLLPDQNGSHAHLMLGGGKEGTLYLVDRDNMGHFRAENNSQIVQSLVGIVGPIFSTPAFWENKLYIAGVHDSLKIFELNGGLLSPVPASHSPNIFGFPGATPAISANGSKAGIVWALENAAYRLKRPAILHAYDANDVSHELYNSQQAGSRDALPLGVGFGVPTVANGKVYVGTVSELDVFGLMQ
jgi:hypothetical protein